MVAQIAVEAAVYAIDRPYSYEIPKHLPVQPGMRVAVPFGRSNRISEGIVLCTEEAQTQGLKQIAFLLDESVLLDAQMLRLAAFLRERYFCTYYEAVQAILPAGLWYRPENQYTILEKKNWREQLQEEDAQWLCAVMEQISRLGGRAGEQALRKQLGADCLPALQQLEQRGFLQRGRLLQRRAGDKTEAMLSLAIPPEEAMAAAAAQKRRAPMQAAVLELLAAAGTVSQKEVCYFTGASGATVRRLLELGYVAQSQQEVLRSALPEPEPMQPMELSEQQRAVFDALLAQMQQKKPGVALLHGVTGSGKTAVYLQLIAQCLAQGKSAMLLVPEISLTPQLLQLLTACFGKQVAAMHSRLRIGERYDAWKRVRRGEARVVVGTRSAVFAPLHSPGIFILDEEHEHSYKSENTPRYHAREVAIYRGAREGALVLLGSATPSVESMYRAQTGLYVYYTLPKRFNQRPLPSVQIVDMKQELRSGNAGAVSRPLRQALQQNAGHQAILLLNRRGSSRMLVCIDCGFVPQCPNCSVNLTYHQANGRLMCHYCGYSQPLAHACPACGGHLKMVGFGTQRVQTELEALLPGEQILRMDADTISASNTHEMILERFQKENIPVLLGTQMVAKGLDFPNVTLVGVLDADAALYMDHFRASETAFSMITQVIGRSGRGSETGTAFVQTMTPEHPVIQLAARQDYDGFYRQELPMRKLRGCPPFADLMIVTFSGLEQQQVDAGAHQFRAMLEQSLQQRPVPMAVLGPAPAPVARVCGRYRYRLTLSLQNTKEARLLISNLLRLYAKKKEARGVSAFVDVNPYE